MSASAHAEPSRLFLLRHGETEFNHGGQWQGSGSDPALNDRGWSQAREAADRLARERPAALYASPLLRCRQTAEIAAERMALELRIEPDLREMNHGHWEGRTREEILAEWEPEFHRFEADPVSVRRPGGESYGDLADRLWPALERIAGRHPGESALVVTHGGPIRLVLSLVLDLPLDQREAYGVGNGEWVAVEWREAERWKLSEHPRLRS